MSQQTQDHQEWAAIENARRNDQYHLNALNALYGDIKPVPKIYYSDLVEEGKVSISVAGVASANTANS